MAWVGAGQCARQWGAGVVPRLAGAQVGLTIPGQAGQGPPGLGLGPAVLQLQLNRVLVAGYFT